LRCSNIDQDFAKEVKEEEEGREERKSKERRKEERRGVRAKANTHTHPPTICMKVFFGIF
jgi:hypothetical protein